MYTIRVKRSSDGWYAIDFPDFPGAHAQCRRPKNIRKEADKSLLNFLLAERSIMLAENSQAPVK